MGGWSGGLVGLIVIVGILIALGLLPTTTVRSPSSIERTRAGVSDRGG